jgi:single-strand DNA-binding protein
MVNKVILLGRLGKDPELRQLDNSRCIMNFPLATNEVFMDRSGKKVEQTEWHNIEMWDGLAVNGEKVLKKGRTVYIEGKLRTESWVDKEGIKRIQTRVRALQFNLIVSPPTESAGDRQLPESNSSFRDMDGLKATPETSASNMDILPL